MTPFLTSWRENLLFPWATALMIALTFDAIVQVPLLFFPDVRRLSYLSVLGLVAGLTAIYAFRTIKVRTIRGSDVSRWYLLQIHKKPCKLSRH